MKLQKRNLTNANWACRHSLAPYHLFHTNRSPPSPPSLTFSISFSHFATQTKRRERSERVEACNRVLCGRKELVMWSCWSWSMVGEEKQTEGEMSHK